MTMFPFDVPLVDSSSGRGLDMVAVGAVARPGRPVASAAVDFTAAARIAAPRDAVLPIVADLGTYPRWFTIVRFATPVTGGAAWEVELGAKVGPFTRTKHLRMVRTGESRFERRETDGRDHSEWILQATLMPAGEATDLRMELHYSGLPAIPGLDVILRNEARSAGARLEALLTDFRG